MMTQTLYIRADATPRIATGHIMRQLALAQAWQDAQAAVGAQGDVCFLCAQIPDTLAQRLRDEGCSVVVFGHCADGAADARATLAALRDHLQGAGAALQLSDVWLVADGYHFGLAFQSVIHASGVRFLVMDDNGENEAYDCDMILNQNVQAQEAMYARRPAGTRLLFGTQYSLMRREFRLAQPKPELPPATVGRVMLTFGGADTVKLVTEVVAALHTVPSRLHIRCILGSLAASSPELESVRTASPHRIEVLHNVPNMTEVMRWADLSINASGATTWECCVMGVPMIVTVLAENQRLIADGLAARGCALNAGPSAAAGFRESVRNQFDALYADPARRQAMIQHARQLVDGRGAMRVVAALNEEIVHCAL